MRPFADVFISDKVLLDARVTVAIRIIVLTVLGQANFIKDEVAIIADFALLGIGFLLLTVSQPTHLIPQLVSDATLCTLNSILLILQTIFQLAFTPINLIIFLAFIAYVVRGIEISAVSGDTIPIEWLIPAVALRALR